ncbi:SirB1 family protein [Aetokthonos hydrillicola Thurmond2011]|jgi:regulator of sirC expression with transglutaminase-like and TPR domain|uniref:SirB1 family protein n=3 Tax=Aetokthonos TaxID=1550243 RepID=A0AAP5IBM9_9CYAN|nr:SirB1 family protein [Aetokthonos hydrillicola]MBW4584250.1 SirB1 family protein [Aetokthonos hydrillicola CCALA 1050]MDR9898541.1 SirB1 family protein [Aetokthonos hydrillicola Thurmond2011]
MNFSSARHFFFQEIQQPDECIDLAKAALYIAQEEYPELDPEEYLNALDTMAGEAEERLPYPRYPLRVIQAINQYLYDDLGFAGNRKDFYDPRNSFFNEVIDRRVGIPITLSLVYLEIARRIDFPMVGVGMPGHFLIRPDLPEMELFVDPFNSGEVMFAQDCQERLSQIYHRPVPLQPEFVATVTPRQFLLRMLTNLKATYLRLHEFEKALAAVDRILLLFPGIPFELRDRGLLCYHLGLFSQAADDLQNYLDKAPNAFDAHEIRRLLAQINLE